MSLSCNRFQAFRIVRFFYLLNVEFYEKIFISNKVHKSMKNYLFPVEPAKKEDGLLPKKFLNA